MHKQYMPTAPQLANSYVPYQQWETPYGPAKGLKRGTIFPSLDLPYEGNGATKAGGVL
ncbi:MAG: spore coat associated protein CotJA [Clostridiales bacterium]|jgi:hypothetical protein|nr:spore coat associated protein CotJA [Clostridiales bacterium]